MDQYVDLWNIMAYDFDGSWGTVAGHQANVYPSTSVPASTPFNSEQAVEYYLGAGIDGSKITLGMPLYGRSFNNTQGPGYAFSGVGNGTWEAGVYDYKAMPLAGSTVHVDNQTVATWSYDPTREFMVSYDVPEIAALKAQYIVTKLGGAMWWEASGDKNRSESLIETVSAAYRREDLLTNAVVGRRLVWGNGSIGSKPECSELSGFRIRQLEGRIPWWIEREGYHSSWPAIECM